MVHRFRAFAALLALAALPAIAGAQGDGRNLTTWKWDGRVEAGRWMGVHNLNGTVTFTNLRIDTSGTKQLTAQAGGFTNGVSGNTRGSGGMVLDVIADRLEHGPYLEGLRLPYVKLPRSPGRSR